MRGYYDERHRGGQSDPLVRLLAGLRGLTTATAKDTIRLQRERLRREADKVVGEIMELDARARRIDGGK